MKKNENKKNISCKNNNTVMIESSNGNTPVSFQLLQDIYNQITGKTEEIENKYEINYILEFNDIEQLYLKIRQTLEQYNTKTQNCCITVFFVEGTKEVFSSFERFKFFNTATLNEIERIYLKLNFMIILPSLTTPQNYEIKINLGSKIAINKKISKELYSQKKIFKFLVVKHASISIKYIDYLVARNFIAIIDEWIKCLPTNKSSKFYKLISEKSHLIPRSLKNIFFLLSIYLIYKKINYFITPTTNNLNLLLKFLIISLSSIYIALGIGTAFGRFIENSIDDYQPLSYIKITKGDEKLIGEIKYKNNKKILKSILGIISTLIIGIIASIIANKINP